MRSSIPGVRGDFMQYTRLPRVLASFSLPLIVVVFGACCILGYGSEQYTSVLQLCRYSVSCWVSLRLPLCVVSLPPVLAALMSISPFVSCMLQFIYRLESFWSVSRMVACLLSGCSLWSSAYCVRALIVCLLATRPCCRRSVGPLACLCVSISERVLTSSYMAFTL